MPDRAHDPFEGAPCRNAPDDWFINPRGRLDEERVQQIEAELAETYDDLDDPGQHRAFEAEVIAHVGEEERHNRRHRRAALAACVYECPMAVRLACLRAGLALKPEHGVWGGYTADEIRQMLEIAERKKLGLADIADVVIDPDRAQALRRRPTKKSTTTPTEGDTHEQVL